MFALITNGDAVILEIRGDLDMTSRAAFEQLLRDESVSSARLVVVSLTRCRYLDSSALSALIAAHRILGFKLRVATKPRSIPARIIEMTGLKAMFGQFDDVTGALDRASA